MAARGSKWCATTLTLQDDSPSSDMYTSLTWVMGMAPFRSGLSVFCAKYQQRSYTKEDTEISSTANIHACYGSNSTTNQSRSRNVSVQWGYMVGAYAVQIVFAIVEHQRYRVCEVLVSTKLVHVWILCEYVCVWLWWCVHIVVCDCVYTYMWRCTLVECAAVYSWHTS